MRAMKKIVFALVIAAAIVFVPAMIVVDVFVHDETIYEAWKGLPHQIVHWLADLFILAWQYKFVTIVAFAIAMAIVYVRFVPDIKNQ